MKTLVIIPARYASTRFPGKPLALLGGRTIIERVWEAVGQTLGVDRVVVATDDERICDHIENIAGEGAAMMTSDRHHSGTDRCGEVVERLAASGEEYDVVVNVQGDEPFVEPTQIQTLIDTFADSRTDIATLRTPIVDTDELLSPNNVKVVCDRSGNALYFSRQPIPYRRDVPVDQWLAGAQYYKHVGLYAFRSHVLAELCRRFVQAVVRVVEGLGGFLETVLELVEHRFEVLVLALELSEFTQAFVCYVFRRFFAFFG